MNTAETIAEVNSLRHTVLYRTVRVGEGRSILPAREHLPVQQERGG